MGFRVFQQRVSRHAVLLRRVLLFPLAISLVAGSACGKRPAAESSQLKTLATDISPAGSRAVHLYFRDGTKIVRTRCPEGELGRTRDRCLLDRKEVDYRWFLEQLSMGVGTRLPALDSVARELYIRFADIDFRLIEIVSAGADPGDQALLQQQLRDIEARVAVVEINIRQLDIQIRAIEGQLTSAPTADLVAQLTLVRRQRGSEAQSLAVIQQQLREVRKHYVDLHGSGLSDHTYQNLLIRRDELAVHLRATQADIDRELDRVVALRSVIEMLEDQAFTTEVINQSASFADEREFVAKFEVLFGTSLVLPSDCRGVKVPGDYGTLQDAWRALEGIGGTICIGAQDFSTVTGFNLSASFRGNGLAFEIAGSGLSATAISSLYLGFDQCHDCTIRIRDLTLKSGGAAFSAVGSGTKLEVARVQFNQYFVAQLTSTGSIVMDRISSKTAAVFECASGEQNGVFRVTNSIFYGAGSSGIAATLNLRSSSHYCKSEIELINNTFAKSGTSLKIGSGISALVQNNLAVGNQTGFDFALGSTGVVRTANNGLTENLANYLGVARPGDGYVTGPALGVNRNTDPPTLLSDSPLRRAGKAAGAPLVDFFGKPRDNGVDIGAVQY